MGDRGFKLNPHIVARFLERLHKGKLRKTRLQMATGLKWSDFSRYLGRLVELGLLELGEENGETYVTITPKGRDLYYSLFKVLRELRGLS